MPPEAVSLSAGSQMANAADGFRDCILHDIEKNKIPRIKVKCQKHTGLIYFSIEYTSNYNMPFKIKTKMLPLLEMK